MNEKEKKMGELVTILSVGARCPNERGGE